MTELILAFLPIIVIIALLILILTQGYVKAPPDHAYIISGIRKEPRVLIGRAGLKIPFFEQLDKLYLGQITVDIKTDEYIPTNDFINVMVFGNKQGPHGKNVAQFLGQDSMSVADFKQELQGLMHRTQINSPALSNADFDFVLRPQDNNLGNTIALSNGADLEERIMERELDSTFKRDMALLQLLARAKDQNASIF